MGLIKVAGIALTVFLLTSLTFQYLIKSKKIKISKISKIFFDDDETFIISWKKTQEKGMLKYITKYTICMTLSMGTIGMIFKFNKLSMYGDEQSKILIDFLSTGIILGLINSLIVWSKCQEKYSRLKEKENQRSNENFNK